MLESFQLVSILLLAETRFLRKLELNKVIEKVSKQEQSLVYSAKMYIFRKKNFLNRRNQVKFLILIFPSFSGESTRSVHRSSASTGSYRTF